MIFLSLMGILISILPVFTKYVYLKQVNESEYQSANSSLKITTSRIREDNIPRNASTFSGYIPMNKIRLKSCHASGPGGQNVNSRNTKVELRFHLAVADWIPKEMRERLLEKTKNHLTKNGELILHSDKTRSYHMNVADVLQRLRAIIYSCHKPEHNKKDLQWKRDSLRKRVVHAKAKRLKMKRHKSLIKKCRAALDYI